AARFDIRKLEALNGVHMRRTSDEKLAQELIRAAPFLPNGGTIARLDEAQRALLLAAMPHLKERAKTLIELADGAEFLFAQRPLFPDEKASELLSNSETRALLAKIAGVLE